MALCGKIWRLGMGLVCVAALYAFTKPFRVYVSLEGYDNIPIRPDAEEKAEWVFGRLMYPQHPYARFARYRGQIVRDRS